MRDELGVMHSPGRIRPGLLPPVFIDNAALPLKKIRGQRTAEAVKLTAKTCIDGTAHIRQIVPVPDGIAPVGQAEFFIHLLDRTELCLQVFFELPADALSRCAIVFGLVVELITDDTVILLRDLTEFPDNPLRIEEIRRICDIHDLTSSVNCLRLLPESRRSVIRLGKNGRILLHKPGRHRIGRCSDNYLHPRPFAVLQSFDEDREIKDAVLLLPCAPRRFRNTDDIHPGFLHHRKVLVDTLVQIFLHAGKRLIFRIICSSI